jgi:t-SNARE complex subunit (syntaxin)
MDPSPLRADVGDLERDIKLLEKTNQELVEFLPEMEASSDEQADIRVVIVENEYAIASKLAQRKEIRNCIPELAHETDFFHKERVNFLS